MTYMAIYNYGSQPYTIYVFTSDQYQAFSQGGGAYAIGEWVVQPHSVVAVQLPYGAYYVVIPPNQSSCDTRLPLAVYVGYGAPIGASSFGPVNTDEVLGFFNIRAISAYNPNGESRFKTPNSGANLQLNAVLEIQLIDGTTQYYWLQDVVNFKTDSNEYRISDNVWNITNSNSVLNSSAVAGNDHVHQDGVYGYATSSQAYSLPLAGYLLIKLTDVNPVEISFCYVIIQNGSRYYPPSFNCYDNVTIYTSEPVSSASIVSDPDAVTPSGHAIDTELVFGGYANGEYTTFDSLSAYLALMYRSGKQWVPYGNLSMNGWNTGEAVTNLMSYVLPNGFIYVTTGPLPSGANALLTNVVPTPTLPMTYILATIPAIGETWSGYVTTSTSFSFPTIACVAPNIEYVLTGVYMNGTLQSGNTVTITPSNDFASYYISANYEAYYLVNVSSPVPVVVSTYNETVTTTDFTEWVPNGSTVTVKASTTYLFSNGVFLSEPGYTITVSKPMDIAVQWQINWVLTGAMYGGLAAVIVIALIIRSRR